MNRSLDVVELRLAHLRATAAAQKGWPHVAVQQYLHCLETVQRAGDARAAAFFASQLSRLYLEMGMPEKAERYARREP